MEVRSFNERKRGDVGGGRSCKCKQLLLEVVIFALCGSTLNPVWEDELDFDAECCP